MDTMIGFLKSLPPVIRKPQGAGPVRFTVIDMATPEAAGWAAWQPLEEDLKME